ncbi:hypothetical protein COT98_04650 [Candidatus Falkowbacteria bacterium CG10_big_fil_rev_8_21_14_0_10_39_9]|uniref:Uncharacterized protein n=1 Tax=Candidatus Falkowbacteria bacterium CG10_big_fil_rev_8_21_14_0_10_39_9 TaxID=1974566 RepID=A0A2M6WND8_9BACT|nr:MAG: hypothetical protein COT98_04650 [Candidatus Falkowbacteria bacterium CG10_big_fil_rev_8_21_14_0_10_39_9]
MSQIGINDPAEAVRLINSGECIIYKPACRWREKDGVIYFTVTSDGTTGEEWIKLLEKKNFCVGDYAKQILRSDDFKPTTGATTEIAVLKGVLFNDNDRIAKNIRDEAHRRQLIKPNAEVACLIREMFTDKEIEAMGLFWIVAMHEPIKDFGGDLLLLSVDRCGHGQWLNTYYDNSDNQWNQARGFAFVVSQLFLFLPYFLVREFCF